MKLPLYLQLKKKAHKDIALAQDIIMGELYTYFPRAVLHGGTAIWRCYSGKRFSEDIDVYLSSKKEVDSFFKQLEKIGFIVHKKRVKENSLYSLLELNRTQVRFEAIFTRKKGILKEYETIGGPLTTIYSLSTDDLLAEKILACQKRRKIRDLYDVFFLLRYVKKADQTQLKKLQQITLIDEPNLAVLIFSGPIPTVKEMKRYIEEWEQ